MSEQFYLTAQRTARRSGGKLKGKVLCEEIFEGTNVITCFAHAVLVKV